MKFFCYCHGEQELHFQAEFRRADEPPTILPGVCPKSIPVKERTMNREPSVDEVRALETIRELAKIRRKNVEEDRRKAVQVKRWFLYLVIASAVLDVATWTAAALTTWDRLFLLATIWLVVTVALGALWVRWDDQDIVTKRDLLYRDLADADPLLEQKALEVIRRGGTEQSLTKIMEGVITNRYWS